MVQTHSPQFCQNGLQRISGIGAVIAVLVVLAGLLVLESALYTIGAFIFLDSHLWGYSGVCYLRLHNGET